MIILANLICSLTVSNHNLVSGQFDQPEIYRFYRTFFFLLFCIIKGVCSTRSHDPSIYFPMQLMWRQPWQERASADQQQGVSTIGITGLLETSFQPTLPFLVLCIFLFVFVFVFEYQLPDRDIFSAIFTFCYQSLSKIIQSTILMQHKPCPQLQWVSYLSRTFT